VFTGNFYAKKLEKILQKSLEVKKKCLPLQSQTKNGVHKASSLEPTSSLKRLIYCTRSKYRENTIYREALILLEELLSVRIKLEI